MARLESTTIGRAEVVLCQQFLQLTLATGVLPIREVLCTARTIAVLAGVVIARPCRKVCHFWSSLQLLAFLFHRLFPLLLCLD
jgi:hypothetical protein